ncbi:hypothetical protein RI129_003922 [Pyrocoelia pectoralis]|uniref:CHK kinase-like domain-containing protein n=1 Tax=Pyrocoelia pectoralis TaxID=417401 RepID=A0AAN7VHP4_9COLE
MEVITRGVYDFIEMELRNLQVQNYAIMVKPVEDSGNIVAKILRMSVIEDFGKGEKHSFILKISPYNKQYQEFIYSSALFEREIYFYSKILPEFEKIQQSVADPFISYAKFYAANPNILLMKDMCTEGFKSLSLEEPLDYKHILLIIREYGKFHALSYILRDLKPDVFREIARNSTENYFTSGKINVLQDMFMKNSIKALKSLDPIHDEEVYQKFSLYIENMHDIVYRVLQPEAAGKYAVIGHGDCWMNNFMIKYDSSNLNVPIELCLLDWQFLRVGSPALDLSYFLFTSTDKNLRDQYYHHFIEEYYSSLFNFYVKLGGNPENCLPYSVLQDHLRKFSIYGLYIGVQAMDIMLNKEKGKNENNSSSTYSSDSNGTEKFCVRIRDVLKDFVAFGYNLG